MKIKKSHLIIGSIGIVLILFITWAYIKSHPAQQQDIFEVNLREHANLALHIHPKVTIEILGETYPIPANIGISPEGMRVIHTHEGDGTLHVEAPYPYQFYLEDFFKIWGKRFTDTCVFEYCEDSDHRLKVYVNGEESAVKGLTPLKDLEQIRVVYS